MKDEAEPILLGRMFIFKDHPAVSILSALVRILAAYESEPHQPVIVLCRSSYRTTDSASPPFGIGEPVPVHLGWFESAGEYSTGPIRLGGDRSFGVRNNALKCRVLRDVHA
jgi:hypothetical protein